MSGDEIVQIVTVVTSAIVAIVGLLVRARIIALEGKMDELTGVVNQALGAPKDKPQ